MELWYPDKAFKAIHKAAIPQLKINQQINKMLNLILKFIITLDQSVELVLH